jgi:RNA polymerase sigma-70 factor (ECF subfamily)
MQQQPEPRNNAPFTSEQLQEFRVIFDLHHRSLYIFAQKLINNKEQVEDIVIDAFVKLTRRWSQGKDPANTKAFLYVVVRNACFDYLRAEQRRRTNLRDFAREQAYDHMYEQELPSSTKERNDLEDAAIQELHKEIEQLPGKCRTIFKMLFLEQKTPAEIGALLKLKPATVRSQKARAIQLLRIQLYENKVFSQYAAYITEKLP